MCLYHRYGCALVLPLFSTWYFWIPFNVCVHHFSPKHCSVTVWCMNTCETGPDILDFAAGFRSDHASLVTISKASHGESKIYIDQFMMCWNLSHILKVTLYTIRESPPQFENRIMARVYIRSITRSTMYQKNAHQTVRCSTADWARKTIRVSFGWDFEELKR